MRAECLVLRGIVLQRLKRYDEARECLAAAIELSEFRVQWVPWTSTLADIEAEAGNLREAVALADAAAEVVPRIEWSKLEGAERGSLAENRTSAVAYNLMLGDGAAARRAALDAFELSQRRWGGISIITQLSLATLAARCGDVERSARLKGYIDKVYASNGEVRRPSDDVTYAFLVAALSDGLSQRQIRLLAADGEALTEDQAADVAFSIARMLRCSETG